MSGIYGDTLLAWPEQQQSFQVYEMQPQVNGGWTITEGSEQTILGVFQNTRGRQIKDNNGNLVQGNGGELWTAQPALEGKFIQIDGTTYRLNASNNWSREGGFIRYGLEKVVGNAGT